MENKWIKTTNGECDIDLSASLPDSGHRRTFDSGAVRDMGEAKGRCDLMPLDVIADIYDRYLGESPDIANIFRQIHLFREDGDTAHLQSALWTFIGWREWRGWSDMLLELAVHFEAGAAKYGEHNWQRGIPVHSYIDSALRHFLKYLRGDTDERHDRAFCWNLMCCIWTMEHKPEWDDFTVREVKENDQT